MVSSILLHLLLTLLMLMLFVVVVSGQGTTETVNIDDSNSCFTSTGAMLIAQATTGTKQLVICPNTEIIIGVPKDTTYSEFIGGDLPLGVLSDNVIIQCGVDGKSSNNCTINGGLVQLATAPNIPQVPGLSITTNNLLVKGITFTGTLTSIPGIFEQSISLSAPGLNMTFDDCIFEKLSGNQIVSLERNNVTAVDAFPPYTASLKITNSIFKNITYNGFIISQIDQSLTIENSIFEKIKYEPCEICTSSTISSIIYVLQQQEESEGDDSSTTITSIIESTFNNIEYKNSVIFVRSSLNDDNLVVYNNTGMGFTSGISSNKQTKHVCDYGLLIANSQPGTLDLTKKIDRCLTISSNINVPGGGLLTDNDGATGGSGSISMIPSTTTSLLVCVLSTTILFGVL